MEQILEEVEKIKAAERIKNERIIQKGNSTDQENSQSEELTALYTKYPLLKRYADPYFYSAAHEGFSGKPVDRIQCLYVAGRVSMEDIEILAKNGILTQEDVQQISKIDKLLTLNNEEAEKLQVPLSTIQKLSNNEVKRAFAIPVDGMNNHTVFDNVGSLVMNGILTSEDFRSLYELGIIPSNLINPKSMEFYNKMGLMSQGKITPKKALECALGDFGERYPGDDSIIIKEPNKQKTGEE